MTLHNSKRRKKSFIGSANGSFDIRGPEFLRNANPINIKKKLGSILPTFYVSLFCTKENCIAFLVTFQLCNFWCKNFVQKTCKTMIKLTPGVNFYSKLFQCKDPKNTLKSSVYFCTVGVCIYKTFE